MNFPKKPKVKVLTTILSKILSKKVCLRKVKFSRRLAGKLSFHSVRYRFFPLSFPKMCSQQQDNYARNYVWQSQDKETGRAKRTRTEIRSKILLSIFCHVCSFHPSYDSSAISWCCCHWQLSLKTILRSVNTLNSRDWNTRITCCCLNTNKWWLRSFVQEYNPNSKVKQIVDQLKPPNTSSIPNKKFF